MSDCGTCGHPKAVHGGWARPDGSCGYRGCDCLTLVTEASDTEATLSAAKRVLQEHVELPTTGLCAGDHAYTDTRYPCDAVVLARFVATDLDW